MNLGDFFPDSNKEEFFQRHFNPGTVINLHCTFTVPPKRKFLLIVSTDPLVVLFVINSELSEFTKKTPKKLDAQVLLTKEEHSFLHYDSYLDCSELHKGISVEEIKKAILADTGTVRGTISTNACNQVLRAVLESKLLSRKEKDLISFSLSSFIPNT